MRVISMKRSLIDDRILDRRPNPMSSRPSFGTFRPEAKDMISRSNERSHYWSARLLQSDKVTINHFALCKTISTWPAPFSPVRGNARKLAPAIWLTRCFILFSDRPPLLTFWRLSFRSGFPSDCPPLHISSSSSHGKGTVVPIRVGRCSQSAECCVC